ncbi:MAG: hypothetical protein N4A65_00435 [Cohaesibacter sp.]|nr:hypothetical protein [Cohaesibacter sp.]
MINQIKGHEVSTVIIESPILPSGVTQIKTLLKLYALNVNTHDIVKALGCSLEEVPVQTWRKHFLLGRTPPKEHRVKGKQSNWYKKAVKQRCQDLGWQIKDDNQADALGLLDYSRSRMDPTYAAKSTPLFEMRP